MVAWRTARVLILVILLLSGVVALIGYRHLTVSFAELTSAVTSLLPLSSPVPSPAAPTVDQAAVAADTPRFPVVTIATPVMAIFANPDGEVPANQPYLIQ